LRQEQLIEVSHVPALFRPDHAPSSNVGLKG